MKELRKFLEQFPITAVKLCNDLLLSGEGPLVNIYDIKDFQKKFSLHVFVDSVIHGIVLCNNVEHQNSNVLICVYGGKKLRLLLLKGNEPQIHTISDVVELNDWIWTVKFINPLPECSGFQNKLVFSCEEFKTKFSAHEMKKSDITLACVLGHNVLSCVNIHRDVLKVYHFHCEEKCILYSALCIGTAWDNIVIASGTVYNQIVMWTLSKQNSKSGRCPVMHRLVGHEGVIFSIDFNAKKQLLASVSDDRSVRLWKIANQNSSYHSILNADEIEIVPQCVLYGHKARVWDVKILDQYYISIGEDATCCVWSQTGEVLAQYKGHKGKSIWSLEVSDKEDFIVTGGGDCSIRKWSLDFNREVENISHTTNELNVPHEMGEMFPRNVTLLNSSTLVIMLDNGVLWRHDMKANLWEKVLDDESFKSYSVVSSDQSSGSFAVANIHGFIQVFQNGEVIRKRLYLGKVHNILWLKQCSEQASILTTGPDGLIYINEVLEYELKQTHELILPYTRQRWVCAALLLPEHELILCGDRGGSVHVYSSNTTQDKKPKQNFWKIHGKSGVTDLVYHNGLVYSAGRDGHYRVYEINEDNLMLMATYKVSKGFEWIAKLYVTDQDVLVLGFNADRFIALSVYSNEKLVDIPCGGGHRAWDFTSDTVNKSMENKQDSEYCFVYIKTRNIMQCRGHIKSNHDVIKESLHGKELCDVKHLFSTLSSCILATSSEDTEVKLHEINYNCNTNMKTVGVLQGHMSAVRTLAVSGTANHDNNYSIYFNQDTSLKADANSKADIHANIQKSDRININYSESNSSNYVNQIEESSQRILFSGGGRAEIKAWQVTAQQVNDCNAPNNNQIACNHKFLAGLSLGEKIKPGYKPWKERKYNPDAETRFMDMTCFSLDQLLSDDNQPMCEAAQAVHVLCVACSDGFARVIIFHEESNKFVVITECAYYDHCVLKIKHLILPKAHKTTSSKHSIEKHHSSPPDCSHKTLQAIEQECKNAYILTAATDGKISIWDVTPILTAYLQYLVLTENRTISLNSSVCKGLTYDYLLEGIDVEEVMNVTQPLLITEAHQSGVNALSILLLSENEVLVASGGDDSSIALTKVQRTVPNNHCDETLQLFTVVKQNKIANTHCSQITGLSWLNDDGLLSVSIDQRINVWHIKKNLEGIFEWSKFIGVSDVSNLDSWTIGKMKCVAICGVGLQVFTYGSEL